MTKAEMEAHRDAYYQHLSDAKSALERKAVPDAISLAISSWDHIDGMMQYERKYESKESFDVEGIDLVLNYAPLLFDLSSLERLEALVKNQRRIAKLVNHDLDASIARARARIWDAHRLWNQLEGRRNQSYDTAAAELGGDRDRWRPLAEAWCELGIVSRRAIGRSYALAFSTDMDESVAAKCPTCGFIAKAPKAKLLELRHCPKCRAKVSFVLLAAEYRARTS
jgi:hypothetical protein